MFVNKCKRRLVRLFWHLVVALIRPLLRVKNNRVFCWAYSFTKYACNPRAVTEYILESASDEYEVYWAFDSANIPEGLDKRIRVVKKYSFRYVVALYTSRFIITNSRNHKSNSLFNKKRTQKYIMTWHGSIGNKPIEKDAKESLGTKYLRTAIQDSKDCDLMLSNCSRFTQQIRRAFWYEGEILEKCSPRNDVFYNKEYINQTYYRVRNQFGFNNNTKIVLYAPTFRNNSTDLECYRINWTNVIPFLENMLGGEVEVLVKLHPNMNNNPDVDSLINCSHVQNITKAPDIQDFMLAADVMISDYSSTMFDFALLKKPCFTYATDKESYDRGFFFPIEQLPFPLAESEAQLQECIKSFSHDDYVEKLNDCFHNLFGLDEDGHSSERLVSWMKNKMEHN